MYVWLFYERETYRMASSVSITTRYPHTTYERDRDRGEEREREIIKNYVCICVYDNVCVCVSAYITIIKCVYVCGGCVCVGRITIQ